ncbi:sporulation histidine kinase inhibitor Sda [Salirhabdus euzebyi]|nr:sporulation histidine kinase inhibitor Sda [Salirhabdus euzebyi]
MFFFVVTSYLDAVKLELNKDFILLLLAELEKREMIII